MVTSLDQRSTGPSGHDDDRSGAAQAAAAAARVVKPRLRGWLHAGMIPVAAAAGIVLVWLAPSTIARVGGSIYLAASLMLFGTSALFHCFTWSPAARGILRRLDHANIYLFIAASYTPFALGLLDGRSRAVLLSVIWGAAVLGLIFRTLWLSAPRWLYTSMYVIVGVAPSVWMASFLAAGGRAIFLLILAGGVLYVTGAAIYGFRRPNPSPRWFGFHEVFHSCTIGAFVCHYIAISLVTYTV
jgi:hemolysin III